MENVRSGGVKLLFLLQILSLGQSLSAAALDDDNEHDDEADQSHDDDGEQPGLSSFSEQLRFLDLIHSARLVVGTTENIIGLLENIPIIRKYFMISKNILTIRKYFHI